MLSQIRFLVVLKLSFSRLLQASEAESLGELHVHTQPGGEDPLHLQGVGPDHC